MIGRDRSRRAVRRALLGFEILHERGMEGVLLELESAVRSQGEQLVAHEIAEVVVRAQDQDHAVGSERRELALELEARLIGTVAGHARAASSRAR